MRGVETIHTIPPVAQGASWDIKSFWGKTYASDISLEKCKSVCKYIISDCALVKYHAGATTTAHGEEQKMCWLLDGDFDLCSDEEKEENSNLGWVFYDP